MIKPELYDVIELLIDLPQVAIKAGQLGTIVDKHNENVYEVEFSNSQGETLAFLSVKTNQFIVVWKSETHSWVSLADRVFAMLEVLPEERQKQVLNFTRSLYQSPV
ncbi:MAG: DUF4926 domain-containing protein [Coleofasciculaceae cyanobacterium SM2_1_6]|nr:DUF4926 domain-containing protein [Coleofasciculaceae cyanobacterium SM2_1_6]